MAIEGVDFVIHGNTYAHWDVKQTQRCQRDSCCHVWYAVYKDLATKNADISDHAICVEMDLDGADYPNTDALVQTKIFATKSAVVVGSQTMDFTAGTEV